MPRAYRPSNQKQVAVEGADKVIEAIQSLGTKNIVNIVKAVERNVLQENIIQPLKAAVPYSAKTKKNIKVEQYRKDKSGLTFQAGVSSDVFWIRFVEKGTKERKGRGRITPRPSAIPVITENTQAVIDTFTNNFAEEVNKNLEKRLKRLKK